MVTIQEITHETLEEALNLLASHLREMRTPQELFLSDWKEIQEFRNGFNNGTHRCWTAVNENGIFIACGWLAKDRLREGYVLPEYRGSGIQKLLIKVRSENGGDKADVRKTNLPSNRSFEKLGWLKEEGIHENYNLWINPQSS